MRHSLARRHSGARDGGSGPRRAGRPRAAQREPGWLDIWLLASAAVFGRWWLSLLLRSGEVQVHVVGTWPRFSWDASGRHCLAEVLVDLEDSVRRDRPSCGHRMPKEPGIQEVASADQQSVRVVVVACEVEQLSLGEPELKQVCRPASSSGPLLSMWDAEAVFPAMRLDPVDHMQDVGLVVADQVAIARGQEPETLPEVLRHQITHALHE